MVTGLDTTEWLPSVSAIIRNTETGEEVIMRQTTDGFTFNQTVLYGDFFNMSILMQPTGHTCIVDHSSGIVTGNVDNIFVICKKSKLVFKINY